MLPRIALNPPSDQAHDPPDPAGGGGEHPILGWHATRSSLGGTYEAENPGVTAIRDVCRATVAQLCLLCRHTRKSQMHCSNW